MHLRTFTSLTFASLSLLAQAPSEQRFSIFVGENKAGSTRLVWSDATHARVESSSSVRGWKASDAVTYTFDAAGNLVGLEGRAESTLGSPQTERFEWKDGRASWESKVEKGSAAVAGPAFYVSIAAGDAVESGFLVKALRRSPQKEVALLPEGRAHLRSLRVEQLGTQKVELVEITGIGLDPSMAWVDEQGELFALVPGLIREGFEPHLKQLKTLEEAQSAILGRQRAKAALKPLVAPLFIQDVAVFDSEHAKLLPHQSVWVEGATIKAVGASTTLKAPAGATIVDGKGKTLIPGLWDMHGHTSDETDSFLTLAGGITTYRDLGNEARRRDALAAAFESGELAGPRILKCLLIDGPGPTSAQFGAKVATEAEAKAVVAQAAKEGYLQIKLYGSLDKNLVPLLAREAHARGLRVSGHIQKDFSPKEAVEAGYDEIQHIYFPLMQLLPEGWPQHNAAGRILVPAEKAGMLNLDGPEAQAWLAFLKAHRTVLDATISLWEGSLMDRPGQRAAMFAPWWDRLPLTYRRGAVGGGMDASGGKDAQLRASYRVCLEFLKRAHALGILLVPGTDGPSGFQLHRELEVMVQAGLSPADVLRQATFACAQIMGRTQDLGSIAPGKAADLVLLEGDPTQNISAIRNIQWVLSKGRLMEHEAALKIVGLGKP
ncbi:MAG TPA: amidohydrolase family protein [Holophagaceae bacterium]|nr:amidohydrolase family protein [Holophagaceae bacterium]